MLDAKEKEELGQGMRIIRRVWAAMMLSLGIYVFVCHRVSGQLPARDNGDLLPTLRTVLFGVAAVEVIVIRPLRRYMLKARAGAPRRASGRMTPGVPPHPAVGRYMSATVVSLALAESIGIYGMLLLFLGADFGTLYLFMAVSAAAMIYYRPKDEELESVALAMKAGPAPVKIDP